MKKQLFYSNERKRYIKMKKNKTQKITTKNQFPDFDKMTYEEEANWWDTHSVAGVWEELEDINLKFEKSAFDIPPNLDLTSAINVRVDPSDHKKLKKIAMRKGLGVATLIRMWIRENIQDFERKLVSS
jgi:predicted DNA binding CopG/RHH family protein